MNKYCLILLFGCVSLFSNARDCCKQLLINKDSDTIDYVVDLGIVDDKYFDKAYMEICRMIDGEDSISIKRAAFLVEWAYEEGNIDYKTFCASIDSTVLKLKYFIQINNLNQYKTAANFALFEYFTKPSTLNGNKAFSYDFEDFTGANDYKQLFVSKLIKTHKGQCFSLPLYYKILSDELGAKSYLALAPHHMYIKHIDEYDRWVNIELTNGHFSTDAYMISSMAISAEAIKNKVYLDALSQKESVGVMLQYLANAYERKYDCDNFVMKCAEKTLSFFPHYMTSLFAKHNVVVKKGKLYVEKYGQTYSPFIEKNYKEYQKLNELIENYGYREMTRENYIEWVKVMDEEKKK